MTYLTIDKIWQQIANANQLVTLQKRGGASIFYAMSDVTPTDGFILVDDEQIQRIQTSKPLWVRCIGDNGSIEYHIESQDAPSTITGVFANNQSLFDAFGRFRVSNPTTIFEAQLQYDKQPLLWDEVLANGGTLTHEPNKSAVSLTVTTASGSSVIRETFAYHRYQAGKSQYIKMTFDLNTQKTNLVQRVGYFNNNNGVFLEVSNDIYFVVRSKTTGSVVDTKIPRSQWNFDKLDGTGVSGVTLDLSKTQILLIDLEWLSAGQVRFGFMINGRVRFAHLQDHANTLTAPYMTTANLPCRYEIYNSGATASSSSMLQICTEVESEGGVDDELGIPFATDSDGAPVTVVAGATALLAVGRMAATVNGIINRVNFRPKGFEVLTSGSDIRLKLIYQAQITGGTWTQFSSGGQQTCLEFNTGGTYVLGSGIKIDGGLISGSTQGSQKTGSAAKGSFSSKLPFGRGINNDRTFNTLALIAENIGLATATVHFGVEWLEVR